MIDLMRRDIQNVLVIDTTGADGDLISRQIIEEIGRLLCTRLCFSKKPLIAVSPSTTALAQVL